MYKRQGPGLHYHLPFPIETAITPKVTTVNRIDIGMRGPSGSGFSNPSRSLRDVPEESLMLTGDENIVDIDFSVFGSLKTQVHFYLKFNTLKEPLKLFLRAQ